MAFRRNFFFGLTAQVSSKLMAIVVTVVLGRVLGPESWGALQWALAGAGVFGALADFGLGSLTTRELALAKEKDRRAWLLAAWQLKGMLWAFALLFFLGFQSQVGGEKAALLLPAALLTVALSLGEFSSALYAGFERMDLDLQWGFLSKLAQALLALAALAAGWGARGALFGMALGAWIGWGFNGLSLWRLSQAGSSNVAPKLKVLTQGLWPFGLVSVLTLIYVKADTLLLGRLAGMSAVGIYQSAYKWFEAVAFVPTAFVAAAFPGLARAERKAEGSAMRLKAYGAMCALGAAAAVFLYAWAPLLPTVMGPAYAQAPPLLQALAGGCLILFPNYVLFTLLIASRQQSRLLLGVALAVLFNVGGNLLLMPHYGALGAAWITVGTEGVIFLATAWSLKASLPWGAAMRASLRALLAAGLGMGLAWALNASAALLGSGLALVLGPLLALALGVWWGLLPLDELRSFFDRILQGKKPA